MGRHRRYTHGSRRTVWIRTDQANALDQLAGGLGLDASHVIRAGMDWSFLRSRPYRWHQYRAALEINWRALTPPVAAAVLAKWAKKKPDIDTHVSATASAMQLSVARRVVTMMRTLRTVTTEPPTNGERAARPWEPSSPGSAHVSEDWATNAPEALLVVLASPWVVVTGDADRRPTTFLAAADIVESAATDRPVADEEGVREAGKHLLELTRSGWVTRLREKEPRSGDAPPMWGWFEISWPLNEAAPAR